MSGVSNRYVTQPRKFLLIIDKHLRDYIESKLFNRKIMHRGYSYQKSSTMRVYIEHYERERGELKVKFKSD